jgi:hypothetical protein
MYVLLWRETYIGTCKTKRLIAPYRSRSLLIKRANDVPCSLSSALVEQTSLRLQIANFAPDVHPIHHWANTFS